MKASILETLLQKPGNIAANTVGNTIKGGEQAILESVISNLRMILESRCYMSPVSDDYPLAQSSIYGYGLSSRHLNRSHYQGSHLCREIELQISRYEPRLGNVMVDIVQLNELENVICFRIEGVIRTGIELVPVGFDSALNLTSISLDIEEACLV